MTVTQQDYDTIVIRVLRQAVHRIERKEIGATIEHIVYRDDVELGRIVIPPGVLGFSPSMNIEITATEEIDQNTFRYICQRIYHEIGLWEKAAQLRANEKSDGQQSKRTGRRKLSKDDWIERGLKIVEVERYYDPPGITYEKACARAGIPYSTFRDWREWIPEDCLNEARKRVTSK